MGKIITVVDDATAAKIRMLRVYDWPEIVFAIEQGHNRVDLAFTNGAKVVWNAHNGNIDLFVTVPGTKRQALYPLGGCGDRTVHNGDAKSLALMLMRWMALWCHSQI